MVYILQVSFKPLNEYSFIGVFSTRELALEYFMLHFDTDDYIDDIFPTKINKPTKMKETKMTVYILQVQDMYYSDSSEWETIGVFSSYEKAMKYFNSYGYSDGYDYLIDSYTVDNKDV